MAIRVYYEGETVRSRFHGLGVVTSTGEHPRVRFLDGPECLVPGDTIRSVPPEVYEGEIRNRVLIGLCLTIRITGRSTSRSAALPIKAFDLATAMTLYLNAPSLTYTDSVPSDSSVLYFD